jgi:hypothetical protein
MQTSSSTTPIWTMSRWISSDVMRRGPIETTGELNIRPTKPAVTSREAFDTITTNSSDQQVERSPITVYCAHGLIGIDYHRAFRPVSESERKSRCLH